MNKATHINRFIATLLFVPAASFPLLAGDAGSLALGSGEPGLKIIYKTTNQFVIFVDEPWTVGPGLIGGYYDRQIAVLIDRNYGLKEKLQTRAWDDIPEQLYSFDDSTVFTSEGESRPPDNQIYITNRIGGYVSADGKLVYFPRVTQVFSISAGSILVSDNIYAMARARYNLATNQMFLGRIGTNIYYWETEDPRKVFYRAGAGESATNYFELSKGIIDVFGVTRGVKETDNIGFTVLRKSKGFFHYSPNEFTFIEFSFKNAKQVKGNQ